MKLGFIGTGKITYSVVTGICSSKIKFNKILGDTTTSINFPANLNISFNTNNGERLRIGALGQIGLGPATNYGSDGQVLTSKGSGAAVEWSTVASSGGITMSTANAGLSGVSGPLQFSSGTTSKGASGVLSLKSGNKK